MTFRYLKEMAVVAVIVTITGLATANAADLLGADIGNPLRAGSTVKTGDVYTVKGGGNDIWNQTDQFHFASTDVTGDFIATVRMDRMRSSDAWTKGGLMARETLYRGSRDVYAVSTPGNGISFQWRPDTGVGATWGGTPLTGSFYGTYGPVWQMLAREGSVFSAAWAADVNGQPGQWFGQQTWDSAGKFADTLKVGLALTSHDNNQVSRAVFSKFNIAPVDPANPIVFDTPQAAAELVSLPNGKVGGKAFVLATNAGTVSGPVNWTLRDEHVYAAGTQGLKTEWFSDNAWTTLAVNPFVMGNIDWVNGNYPAATKWTGNHDNYSVRVTGEIELKGTAEAPVTYTFWDANDDYAKLTIQVDGTDKLLIDDNSATGYYAPSTHIPAGQNSLAITADGWYPIEFLMREGGGGDNGQLFWDAGVAGGAKTLVPADKFRLAEDVLMEKVVARGRGIVGDEVNNGQFGDVTVVPGANYKLDVVVGYGVTGYYEAVLGGAGAPTAVPEPSTMVLAGLGLVGLAAFGWRRRKPA